MPKLTLHRFPSPSTPAKGLIEPIIRASTLACIAHNGQNRKDGQTPQVLDALALQRHMVQADVEETHILAASALHDAVEDNPGMRGQCIRIEIRSSFSGTAQQLRELGTGLFGGTPSASMAFGNCHAIARWHRGMVMKILDLSKGCALSFALKLAPVLFLGACQTLPNDHLSINNSSAPVIKVVAPPAPRELIQGIENFSPKLPEAFMAETPSTHKLWGRIRSGFAIGQLGGNAVRLQSIHEKWYRERPEHLERVFTRAQLYLFDIVEATEQSGLPLEIALLPAVESALMPTATSSAAADGLWQFIAPTARRYDLKVHLFLDQRRDVRAATRAALRYLQDLRLRYGGDMQLALAAYNCGEGCIDEHIRRAKARGLQGRLEDLDLNRETANYVPRLLALTKLVAEGVDNNRMSPLGLPPMQNAPYFAAVPIRRDIDVSRAAQLCGLSLQEFKALNPQHKKPVIVATAREEVLVPIDRANAFAEALLNNHGPMSTWTTVVVNQSTLPSVLAGRHGTSTKTLQEVNGIKPGHLIKAGSTVLVPRNGTAGEITSAVSEAAVINTTPIVVSMKVTVRRGESWKHLVARMNAQGLRVTANMIQTYNPKLRLRAGPMTIRIPAIAQATTT